jgi:hypothetical protein
VGRSGTRLNRPMITRMIANRSPSCAFKRPKYRAGGTYLFDASGSMDLSDEALEELCQNAPAATVAYYCGYGLKNGHYGDLTIYAKNGMRAAKIGGARDGGNEIDLYALEWLLKQQAPRVLVTDRGFCGGPSGQNTKALKLLQSSEAQGHVVCVEDLEGVR